jgi:pyruvate dehydrogenase E2 component (dihydrolipoamide acetyltransferase)
VEFQFPDVGEGISEGEVVRWHVSEGDRVDEDDTLLEVETDKAIVDIPSPAAGTIGSIEVEEGATIEVGQTLLTIDVDEESIDDTQQVEDDDDTVTLDTSSDEEDAGSVVGSISTDAEVLEGEENPEDEPLATPSTRQLAQELGVDLSDVEGTGNEGRITDDDVRRAASESVDSSEQSERVEEDDWGAVRVKPLTGTRKAIAQRMRASAFEIPQATHMDQADVTDLHERVDGIETVDNDAKLTLLPFFIKAIASGIEAHPVVNATLDKQQDEIILKDYVNIGVGVDTDHGLMVPVVRDADEKDLPTIAREVNRKAEECRDRSIDLEELRGGTFTITNIGFVGGKWSTPKINYPEAAIMATGRAEPEPAVVDGEVVPRRMLPISISFDHRILDGAEVARFTNHVIERLESPASFNWESF